MAKTIMYIVGARPQFIKLAPLVQQEHIQFKSIVVHTGQHVDDNMSRIFFDQLGMQPPDRHLSVTATTHGEQIGAMLISIEKEIQRYQPDGVVVFGDTNSTLAAALVAIRYGIPLLHIEAGLRSFDKTMPEEQNRVVVDHLATHLAAPTPLAVAQLNKEGIDKNVWMTGDIMVDSLKLVSKQPLSDRVRLMAKKPFVLMTIHRASNTDNREVLVDLMTVLATYGKRVVFPIHPRTCKQLKQYGIAPPSNVEVIEPVGYRDMVGLMTQATHVVTDSGGLQKEAFLLKKPCITVRHTTEWQETINQKTNCLVMHDAVSIDQSLMVQQLHDDYCQAHFSDAYGHDVAEQVVALIDKEMLN